MPPTGSSRSVRRDHCGRQAFQVVEQWEQSPDVIVSDFQLNAPLTGADLIEQLRRQRQREIPAVVLSGDTIKVSPRCSSITACRVFHKPVDAEELSANVSEGSGCGGNLGRATGTVRILATSG